jgi:arylformamidase
MNAPDKAFLSREYNNRELVPEHPQFFARWAESSARARSTMTVSYTQSDAADD